MCFPFLHSCCVKSALCACVCVCVWWCWGGGGSAENILSSSIWGLEFFLNVTSFAEKTLKNVAPQLQPLEACVEAGSYSHYVSTLFEKASVWLLLACLNVCV